MPSRRERDDIEDKGRDPAAAGRYGADEARGLAAGGDKLLEQGGVGL